MKASRKWGVYDVFDDLTRPDVAYIVGLLQTDGHHDGSIDGKGKVTIELAARDADVLRKISDLLPCYSSVTTRIRTMNFSATYESAVLSFFDQRTRRDLVAAGVPVGPKSKTIAPPVGAISEADYVRGLLDGDGSVGFTGTGVPFVSFVTVSPPMAHYFCGVVQRVCGVARTCRPNARDGARNVMVANHAAAKLAAWAWYSGDVLGIPRKQAAAHLVARWQPDPRKAGRYGVEKRRWTAEEDAVVLSVDLETAALRLRRTIKSVYIRRWRLMKN